MSKGKSIEIEWLIRPFHHINPTYQEKCICISAKSELVLTPNPAIGMLNLAALLL